MANHDGECVEPVILQESNRPPVLRQAMGEHVSGIGIVKAGSSPIRVARHAQHIESKAALARPREDINGSVNVARPDFVRHATFDIEYSACDREVGDFRGLRSYPPLTVVALTMKLTRLLDHVWRNVVANETAF